MKYKKKDKNYVLEDLNFSIKKGSFHAFIGENGAGKSTTIKIIAGLNNDYDGNVIINGLNVKENIEARKSFSYVADKMVFLGGINTWEYIYNTALLVRNDKEGLKAELNNLLKKFEQKYNKIFSNNLEVALFEFLEEVLDKELFKNEKNLKQIVNFVLSDFKEIRKRDKNNNIILPYKTQTNYLLKDDALLSKYKISFDIGSEINKYIFGR